MAYNDRLFNLLHEMKNNELDALWENALKNKPQHKDFDKMKHSDKVTLISKELREVSGHSILNIFRKDHELPWKTILIDVADKLKPGTTWTEFSLHDNNTEADIERRILEYVDQRTKEAWDKLSAADQQQTVDNINKKIQAEAQILKQKTTYITVKSVTVDSMSNAVAAGLLTGGGLATLISGSAVAVVGGVVGSILAQIGLWLVLEFAGWWLGLKLIFTGSLGAIGLAAIAAPAAVIAAGTTLMTPSYSKTIPAVITILASHQTRQLFR